MNRLHFNKNSLSCIVILVAGILSGVGCSDKSTKTASPVGGTVPSVAAVPVIAASDGPMTETQLNDKLRTVMTDPNIPAAEKMRLQGELRAKMSAPQAPPGKP